MLDFSEFRCEVNYFMGWGSAGTPPWVDEEAQDLEKKEKTVAECTTKIRALEKENAELKKRIKELEAELKKQKK
jgi:predicted RNase H-like nuclease (RuvC/YqgF family)